MPEAQKFPVDGPVQVEVRVAGGDVSISTAEVREASVSLSGPQEVIDATTVTLRGGTLSITQAKEKGLRVIIGGIDWAGFTAGAVGIEVVVPHGSSADLASASSDVELDGEFIELANRSASGDLEVRGTVFGDVSTKSVSGAVEIQHVGGDVRVQSVSGAVTVGAVDGSAYATTVSGDIALLSLYAGTANVRTVSGRIELGIARGTGIDVDATSASGDMTSDVPLTDTPADGDGSTVVIRARTASGDVHIMRAPEREPLLRG